MFNLHFTFLSVYNFRAKTAGGQTQFVEHPASRPGTWKLDNYFYSCNLKMKRPKKNDHPCSGPINISLFMYTQTVLCFLSKWALKARCLWALVLKGYVQVVLLNIKELRDLLDYISGRQPVRLTILGLSVKCRYFKCTVCRCDLKGGVGTAYFGARLLVILKCRLIP